MTKEEKSIYDKIYREKNKALIKLKKKAYYKTKAGKDAIKRNRQRSKEYRKAYNKKPDQRLKERLRRYKREGKDKIKHCIVCDENKHIMQFENCITYPDNYSHICKDCENHHREELGCKTKNVITAGF